MDPNVAHEIIILTNTARTIGFNLMCSEFTIVQRIAGNEDTPAIWKNMSQPNDSPWIFSTKVDLRMTNDSNISNLSPEAQNKIRNLGNKAFSLQQLLFDLDSAALQSPPVIHGVEKDLEEILQKFFVGAYFSSMKKSGSPILGCAVVENNPDHSSFNVTDIKFVVSPYLDYNNGKKAPDNPDATQRNCASLNYVCTINNKAPINPVPFTWNWITNPKLSNAILVVNRNTVVNYLKDQLIPFISRNCYNAWTRVWLSGFFSQNCHYEWRLNGGQSPKVQFFDTGAKVLHFEYSSAYSDTAGLGGDMGQMELRPSYNVTVECMNNKIIIVQHLVIYCRIQRYQTSEGGNIVDKTITDTYTLSVNDQGHLITTPETAGTDNSQHPSTNGFLNFFTDLNSLLNDVSNWAQNFSRTQLTGVPVFVFQDFIFPGGKTFAFKQVGFNQNGDMVTVINYIW